MTTAEKDLSHRADVATRLLDSSDQLSYDPVREVDWDSPVDPLHHGASPEWSTLYGTPYWDEMTEEQRAALTRQEAASVASTGIWFEMILQQMVIRDFYAKDPTDPAFQWALTEVADECRHSIMFARGAKKLGAPAYRPPRHVVEGGRVFKTLARGEAAYAAILVAEEVLDVMQRDWMRDERVAPFARTINNIHVVEEARHMRFAREETRERLQERAPPVGSSTPSSSPSPATSSSRACGTARSTRTRASTRSAPGARRGATRTTVPCCARAAPGSWSSSTPRACSRRRPRRSTAPRTSSRAHQDTEDQSCPTPSRSCAAPTPRA